jgi:amino acid transporter
MAEIDESVKPPDGEAVSEDRILFGTFGGVFTPTLLTILGVIMFLREGWVIGQAGLLGGLLIIVLSFGITAFTALSMSSITTNIRIGAGGAYAILSQSLGLEVGGSVGIPRYLSQALAVTMYIFGFREGWVYFFETYEALQIHPLMVDPLVVDVGVFLALYAIAYVSADLAIRVQYVIMVIIGASLVSIAVAAFQGSMQTVPMSEVQLWGEFAGSGSEEGGASFWLVFSVFFPATTGIMAGANMSGDLETPRRSIPVGTMAAVGVSFVIYVVLAYWLARSATSEQLRTNYYVMMDQAAWPPAVLGGLLGATFSSALASMVGSGRILQAMGAHQVVPFAGWLEERTDEGEPRHAMLVTGAIIFLSLMVRDLNAITPLITMFFLITYAMINAAVMIEQSLNFVSFRPRLEIPRYVPIIGFIGSIGVMFIISPTVSILSVIVTVAVYWYLSNRRLDAPFEDVRSGLFVALAEWAAEKVQELPTMQERAWKPNLLVPVENTRELRGMFLTLENILRPQGTIKVMGIQKKDHEDDLWMRLDGLAASFRERGLFSSVTVIRSESYAEGIMHGMQALRGAFFKPNTLFLPMPKTKRREAQYRDIINEAMAEDVGTLLYAPHSDAGLGQRSTINVWIRDRGPEWKISMDIGNLDLSMLIAYKMARNWNAKLNLITVVDEQEREEARLFLDQLIDLSRFKGTQGIVGTGSFDEYLHQAPEADLQFIGLLPDIDFEFPRRMVRETESTCMFIRDSGRESVLA